jgi:hypothetical protein
MIRRQFIQLATLAGVIGLATVGAVTATETRTVTYGVKGFSCITCAVGLTQCSAGTGESCGLNRPIPREL